MTQMPIPAIPCVAERIMGTGMMNDETQGVLFPKVFHCPAETPLMETTPRTGHTPSTSCTSASAAQMSHWALTLLETFCRQVHVPKATLGCMTEISHRPAAIVETQLSNK